MALSRPLRRARCGPLDVGDRAGPARTRLVQQTPPGASAHANMTRDRNADATTPAPLPGQASR